MRRVEAYGHCPCMALAAGADVVGGMGPCPVTTEEGEGQRGGGRNEEASSVSEYG